MTLQLAPQTVFNDLMGRAVDILHSEQPSEMDLRRLEREVDRMVSADPSGALELRAHICAARADYQQTDSFFERALSISDDYRGTVVRYILVLGSTVQAEKVFEVFSRHRDLLRSDPAAMRTVESVLAYSGWIMTAYEISQELARMGVQQPKDTRADAVSTVDGRGFAESDIVAPVAFSHRYLRGRGIRVPTIQTLSVPFEDGKSSILIQFAVDRDPQELAQIEWDMFGALEEAKFPAEQQGLVTMALTSKNAMTDGYCCN